MQKPLRHFSTDREVDGAVSSSFEAIFGKEEVVAPKKVD